VKGSSQQAIVAVLAGRSAIVTPEKDGCVVVFDEQSDEQDSAVIKEFASHLSHELHCPVLAVLNHDDDIFWYQLYLNGELADEYDSSPGYFDPSAEPSVPAGGNAKKLCGAFGAAPFAKVENILRKDGYTFAIERHTDLVRALGIPAFGVGAGFGSVADGNLPEGLDEDSIVRIGESEASGGITSYTEYKHIITTDPKVRNGEPCIRGLPIAVSDIFDYVAAGMNPEQIIAKHNELTVEDVMACMLYVAHHYPKKS